MSEWIQEGYGPGEDEEPEEIEEEPANDRDYGFAVSFPKAFAIQTVIKLAERMGRANPLIVFFFGVAILVATQLRIGFEIPFPRFYDRIIIGSIWGAIFHQSLFNIHLGIFTGSYVVANVCNEVAVWVRGEGDPDIVEVGLNWKTGVRGIAYEVLASFATWAVCSPFVGLAMFFAYIESESMTMAVTALAVGVGFIMWMATRPGLWGVAVDDLPPHYALMQSLVVPLRYPFTVFGLFVVAGVATAAGGLFLFLPSFIIVGAFHCGVAGAWVLFGASADEIDNNKMLGKLVKVHRVDPL